MKTVSETLRSAIRADGRSLYRLSLDAGVDRAQLVRFANAGRSLTLPAVDKLCRCLGLALRPVEPKKEG